MGRFMAVAIVAAPRNSQEAQQLAHQLTEQDSLELKSVTKAQERQDVRLRFIFGKRVDEYLEGLNEEELVAFGEERLGWFLDEDIPGGGVAEIRRTLRHQLMLDIETIYLRANNEVTELYLSDRIWLVSGGMSSGDEPTDAYAPIQRLEDAQIFEEEVTIDELRAAVAYEKEIRDA
ncbi:hypothetical protein PBI_DEWDROP_127 [Microbacterium phage Dewdrop]|nr:hypothetical protein PBI_LEAF_127 [Microbacterium phage Leaf]QGZ17495.1 hypothetical protein PBI_DEWDROP_127 [Microbacterium phage Dewdrop]